MKFLKLHYMLKKKLVLLSASSRRGKWWHNHFITKKRVEDYPLRKKPNVSGKKKIKREEAR